MRTLPILFTAALLVTNCSAPKSTSADDLSRVLKPGERPQDRRLGKLRTLRDAYHPWVPPKTKAAWEKERQAIREQVLVSTGLWPMPPKQPLKPVIHGKIDRGDYTVEKVFFASHPGHYVSGNLYRPKTIRGKVPGVLCPHGHWPNGRFYDAGEKKARDQIAKGAEKTMAGARYPIQARLVQLARMGCVVFHYDMVGYADSKQIAHRAGFTDVEAGLRLQNFMGLQTFNSIRALDFLMSLPEVDSSRIGVTGASGGGTQTFMLGAVDPRPTVAFPAVMVSTGMQGGCVCENAELLRIGINNIAIAAMFSPKPMAMSGAHDWTIAIETKGLPELRKVYGFYGKQNDVYAKAFPQFQHNYNRVSRTVMYNWFNKYLKLGLKEPVEERDFRPIPPAELSVYDKAHPRPKDAGTAADLRKYLTDVAKTQYARLLPRSPEQVAEYKRVVGTAARVMLDRGIPEKSEITARVTANEFAAGAQLYKGLIGRKGSGEQVPWLLLVPETYGGKVVLWIDGRGKSALFTDAGEPIPAVRKLLDARYAVASADPFLTGEYADKAGKITYPKVDATYQGFTFGYNRPVLSNRVRDILTVLGGLVHRSDVTRVHLVGTGQAGPWVLLARGLAGDRVDKTVVDANGFSFRKVGSTSDPMFLPGALKYGGLGGLAALAAPGNLMVAGLKSVPAAELKPLTTVYSVSRGQITLSADPLTPEMVADRLAGKPKKSR